MSPEFMSRTLSEVAGSDATIVNELGLATQVMDFEGPYSFFGPATSGGLGWNWWSRTGRQVGRPERLVIWATGDGSYVFSNPAACHHAAASLGLGLLTVVADNRVWNAVRRSTIAVYPQGNAARQSNATHFASNLHRITQFVEAYGGYGESVSRAEDLKPALERAIEVTRTGRQALIAVHCSYPNATHH